MVNFDKNRPAYRIKPEGSAVESKGEAVIAMMTEAFALFEKYRALLDGEFHTEAAADWVDSQCNRINRRLMRRGYEILSGSDLTMKRAGTQEEGDITAIKLHFKLYLMVHPPQNQTPTGIAHATSVIWRVQRPTDDSLETILKRTEEHESEEKAASASVWNKTWEFDWTDTCAFLAALERHWGDLKKDPFFLEKKGVPSKEDTLQLIRSAREFDPMPVDMHVISFLLDRELEYLSQLSPDTELPACGCEAKDHLQSLEDWEMRNLL